MYISLKWVQNRIGLKNISLSVLCERLTLAGFEIEEILQKSVLDEIDFILDVSLTANRSDIFNVKGFTKELLSIFLKEKEFCSLEFLENNFINNAILDTTSTKTKSYVWENYLQKKFFEQNRKDVSDILNFDFCACFISNESETLKVQASPKWLQKCLISSNILPVNNIVDSINFVNLETGYPFFCCDLNKLKTFLNASTISFEIRNAFEDEQFFCDSETIVKLKSNNLVLLANGHLISILGVFTIKNIEVDEKTTNILIYGGLFDPVKIRKSAQSLGIRTDSSIRLEKNLNYNGFEQAFIRLSFLFNVQGITFHKNLPKIYTITTLNKTSFNNYVGNIRPILKLEYKNVLNLLGSSELLKPAKIIDILEALNFEIIEKTEDGCKVFIPFSRENDLEREIDLIEEIVRISGFTSFTSIVPTIGKKGVFSKLEKLKRFLRKSFVELGFNEALHYSISTNQLKQQLELKNPIVPESSFFRSSLVTQMIQKAAMNKKQKNNVLEAFEIGRVYSLNYGNIVETELVSGIFGGNLYSSNWEEDGKTLNWFEAKGIIQNIFDLLNIDVLWSKDLITETKIIHPGRSALLTSKNQTIGFFGQIHPTQAKINSLNNEIYLFEFNIEVLKNLWKEQKIYTYKPYSLFPVSLVDLAFIKNNEVAFKDVEAKIWQMGGPLLEKINLFDYYSGVPIPEGYHSLGFKLQFRNLERTLTSEEVENIVKKITISLEKEFDILIRK